ncbi:MAG: aminotransferase class I/II-fold pyridoxal phosphate-dependent enzyme [Phycisphaerales bacterium]
MSMVSQRFAPFGTTVFAEMTALATKHGAVNLSQGFPDFDGPEFAKAAVVRALAEGRNQYGRMQGLPELNRAIVESWKRSSGLEVDGETQVTVTAGCTEALAATFLGLINPGDEVILFEPYYDCYRAGIAMAGGVARTVWLRPPTAGAGADGIVRAPFEFDAEQLRRAFTSRTRAIVVNTPNNPTGKVFTREELGLIAELCVKYGVVAITDEVYERLTFSDALPHVHLATLPGMSERTITLSSLGKTYSLTGWKTGWAIASRELSAAVRAAHQFLTFCSAIPIQLGAAEAITQGEEYVRGLRKQLQEARDYLAGVLARVGFRVYMPDGTYFIMVDHTPVSGGRSDVEFCRWLTTEVGVAAISPSVFYEDAGRGRSLARFAFCKKMETLHAAAQRLERLRG